MLSRFACLCVAALAFTGVMQAQPVFWTFTGNVVACPSTPEIDAYVQCNGPLHGSLVFDDATAPSAPGEWWMPGAEFHAEIGDLILDGTGAGAHVWINQDGIDFFGTTDSSNYPGLQANWDISIFVWVGGYYGRYHLPSSPPVFHDDFFVDESLTVWFGVPRDSEYVSDHIGTDTQFGLRRTVPEPPPLALYCGLGVILISMRRFFASRPSATRKFVAPRP